MKSHITVIIRNSSTNILSDLKLSLEPHRLDENSPKQLKNHHWDYWFLPEESEFRCIEIEKKFTELGKEMLSNTSFIKNLPENYTTSGIIDLENNWIDLQDFGWKMTNEASNKNRNTLIDWNLKCKEILERNKDHICVQVILHS